MPEVMVFSEGIPFFILSYEMFNVLGEEESVIVHLAEPLSLV
jgi:hypothetical protein